MAGRNHPYSSQPHSRPSVDDPRVLPRHSEGPSRPHPGAVIEAQQREIQALLLDNQRLAATHVVLKQELAAADQELRHLSSKAASIKAECDAQVREVYEKSLKTEAELRSVDKLSAEVVQVKSDIQKMTADRKEFTSKLREMNEELVLARSELLSLPAIEEEIQAMRQEIKKGRAAIEYEKKMHATNDELSQILEKNMLSMACEVEKLRAELANAETRAKAAAATAAAAAAAPAPGYPSMYSETAYGVNLYQDHYPMQQVQSGTNVSQYVPGVVPQVPTAPYDVQWSNVHR